MKPTQAKKPSTKDNKNVRIGTMSPVFDEKTNPKRKNTSTKDSGRVRIGTMSPLF
ncbi:MAG: hypothetical protein GY896_14505 [Gammaproteobacteria bacterium]|nr:hypothetical protein [Gammaproteobacteria bacterium]